MLLDPEKLLLAYLHDPPDKALEIKSHVGRACRYAATILGRPVTSDEFSKHEDQVASAIERLPMPKAGKDYEWAVGLENGSLQVVHPLSGDAHRLTGLAAPDENIIEKKLREVIAGLSATQQKFLALWRSLPESLAALNSAYLRLPADTRTPDHSIWNHLDIVAGLQQPLEYAGGPAFLSFALGPVQSFIAGARSVRDLWSGSMILSYLTFRALLPVVKECGPTALVYPALRGVPLLDLWLRREQKLDQLVQPLPEKKLSPCLPNKFVAVVPWGSNGETAKQLAADCESAARSAWNEIADAVHKQLKERWKSLDQRWAKLWQQQIDNFWDIQTTVLPWRDKTDDGTLANLLQGKSAFAEAFKDTGAQRVRELAEAIPSNDRPGYFQRSAGQWQYRLELSARIMAAQRSIRRIPEATPDEAVPPKCSLLGSYEQMGPADLSKSREFWEEAVKAISKNTIGGIRLGQHERLCAISLVKRFCGPAFFASQLELEPSDFRYPDTATVAAALWLQEVKIDPDEVRKLPPDKHWSGQWLHWSTDNQDEKEVPCPQAIFAQIKGARQNPEIGSPPTYYAILMMDGDEMGKWLRGEKSPEVQKVMHRKLQDYFRGLSDSRVEQAFTAQRPVGPALHAAISEALANFALQVAPPIIKNHNGTLIYAGGDDVLALLPTETALKCALELYNAYRGEVSDNNGAERGYYRTAGGREVLMMGPTATLSAGLAIVHYKEDLRFALEQARRAEKEAKATGRNALVLRTCRRSGEHSSALCPWTFVDSVAAWVQAFRNKASDRWSYHLRGELPTLQELPLEAMAAEIRRQVNRAESATTKQFETEQRTAGEILAQQFGDYHTLMTEKPRLRSTGEALTHFLTLCQTASFLARGRDA